MPRTFSESVNDSVISLLNKLIDKSVDSEEYRDVMFKLGMQFGDLLLKKIDDSVKKVTLASTFEDADYLGKGIIDVLEQNGKEVLLTVFWNKRFNPSKESDLTVAPIVKEFHEIGYRDAHVLIIIKSIISSSCIVRTNLTKLINEFNPDQILVVAPVLLKNATTNLESEFDTRISEKFEYLYFAEDDQKTNEGFVYPGIGGDVYQRLGISGQEPVKRFVPTIVKDRRLKHMF